MFGRIIGALAGRSIARNVGTTAGGLRGAAIGAALPTVMRRMGPMGMIAAAAGGYAVKRLIDKRRAQQPASTTYSGPKVRP
ncbi:MAG: hypothetical protein Q7J32_05170 [Sphingomonadaceae bacterium]|nr:hypothetical protein [Sphingomonadaceae bacterium]